MKCQYCGSNLGIEDKACPYCGKINDQAAKYQAVMQEYRDEYEQAGREAKVKSKFAGRTGRFIVIAIMLAAIIAMRISASVNSDVGERERKKEHKIAKDVDRNRDEVSATLEELEKNRDYLKLDYYVLNYRLRSDDKYNEYSRVFTAAISYTAIYNDILNILDGFAGYEDETDKDRCYDAAIYISDWNSYAGGEFWNDASNSPMHSGEHGAFLADIKRDTQDMVQVYFDLTDEQALSMWNMDREALGELLYTKCKEIYPKDSLDE